MGLMLWALPMLTQLYPLRVSLSSPLFTGSQWLAGGMHALQRTGNRSPRRAPVLCLLPQGLTNLGSG